jgi:hypothetical protein
MKKCPVCDKTFPDTMRFCQVDGTPLVDDAPALDPFKTMVARPEDVEAATAPPGKPVENEVLEIPAADPKKTMYASEDEIRKEMEAHDAGREDVVDIPPAPEPPKFDAPPASPFSAPEPPPSPFGAPEPSFPSEPKPSIPSPFDTPKAPAFDPPKFDEPKFEAPKFESPKFEPAAPAEPAFNPFDKPAAPKFDAPAASSNPFDKPAPMTFNPPAPAAEWAPPSAPAAGWPQAGEGGQVGVPVEKGPSSVLAIVSLALGIVGFVGAGLTLLVSIIPILLLICGTIPFLIGIGAVITGFLARSRANSMPESYSGAGLALGGIILGVLDILAPIGLLLLWILAYGAFFAASS